MLPIGYTFDRENQQYIVLGEAGESWSWSTSNGDRNGTVYAELDNISVRNYIDVEVIDDYNNTGRQLVRATFQEPPIASGWEGLSQFRFSFYVNQVPMLLSGSNEMQVFPSDPVSAANLRCQRGFSSSPQGAPSSEPNDLDGDGITVGDAYCQDDDQIRPSSTTLAIESFKAVKGDMGTEFEAFPAIGAITTMGGTADFQLNMKNNGGVGLENWVIYDVLPYVGDTGLSETQVGNPRGSDFEATFVAIDASTVPAGAVIEYSESNNPCRDELTTGATPFPTGCVNDWTTTLPTPAGDVRALRITFPSGDLQ
ncbi:MAG: hypothetical protein AAFO82_15835, partial [Bacteroidota bacterium]